MKKRCKNNREWNKRHPDCFPGNNTAENRADSSAGKEKHKHFKMLDKLFPVFRHNRAAVAKLARDIARLPDVAYITVFYGADVDETAADAVREALERECPAAEVSVVYGGQPIYYYIISAE